MVNDAQYTKLIYGFALEAKCDRRILRKKIYRIDNNIDSTKENHRILTDDDFVYIDDENVSYFGIELESDDSLNTTNISSFSYGDINYLQEKINEAESELTYLFQYYELDENIFNDPQIISILHFT